MSQAIQNDNSISDEIVSVILAERGIDRANITPDATLETLGLESIDLVMAMMTIEEKFGIYVPLDGELTEAKNFETFVDRLVQRIQQEREKSEG